MNTLPRTTKIFKEKQHNEREALYNSRNRTHELSKNTHQREHKENLKEISLIMLMKQEKTYYP